MTLASLVPYSIPCHLTGCPLNGGRIREFYWRLWIRKEPEGRAIWEAKMRLRAARRPDGTPRYGTRDWAGWVLTGDPD